MFFGLLYQHDFIIIVQSRPDLFKPADIPTRYSLGVYHTMGTRLLSRSFTLDYEEGEVDDVTQQEQETERVHSTGSISAMDVDSPHAVTVNNILQQDDQSQFSEITEEVVDLQLQENEKNDEEVVLVPLADMLNARFKENNVMPLCFRIQKS
jgi:SET domain-containing protein 6